MICAARVTAAASLSPPPFSPSPTISPPLLASSWTSPEVLRSSSSAVTATSPPPNPPPASSAPPPKTSSANLFFYAPSVSSVLNSFRTPARSQMQTTLHPITREAALLLAAQAPLADLLSAATELRARGKGTVITYSKKVFIPLTT